MLAAHIENIIAGDYVSEFVNRKASVCVAVESKAYIELFFENESAQSLDMRGTAVGIYICTVRRVVYYVCMCAECVENALCEHP